MSKYQLPAQATLKALETSPAMFLILSPEFKILTASDLYLQAIDAKREELVGKYIFDAFPNNPDYPEADGMKNIHASLLEVLRTKKPHHMLLQRYDVPDRSNEGKSLTRYWDTSHTPVLDENGAISYIIQLANNVTDVVLMHREPLESKDAQLQSEEKVHQLNDKLDFAQSELLKLNFSLEKQILNRTKDLKESEAKYRALIQHSPIAMQVFSGADLRFEVVNQAMLKFLGKTEEIIGKTLFEGVPEIIGQPIVEVLNGVYENGTSLELFGEEVLLERDGKMELGYYDVIYRPLYDEEEITGVLGIAIDVTAQEKAKLALKESEDRFRNMAEGSDIMISTVDIDGKIEYLNKAWEDFAGKNLSEITAAGWPQFIHPEDYDEVMLVYNDALQRHIKFTNEMRMLRSDGRYRWLRIQGTPRLNADGSFVGYVCSCIDFSDQKQQLLEIAYINSALVNANEQLAQSNALLRNSEEDLQSAFNAGDLGSCSLDLKTGKAEMSSRYRSLYGLPETGEITWEMVTAAVEPEFLEEVNTVMQNAVKLGADVDSTYAIAHLQTGERRWMRVVGKVYKDENGDFDQVKAVVMDVTIQKQDEQRKNDFIAMVSHELKTPLTSVTAYTQMVQRILSKSNEELAQGLLRKMERQVKKMASMINGFLNISRLESGKIQIELQQFDMVNLATEIVEEFTETLSSHQIVFDHEGEVVVEADRDKIGHVMNNLISNAIKYSPGDLPIHVVCKVEGNSALFFVKDQGIGVNKEDLSRLFDRYYRVQGTQVITVSGFGIGLYLSAEIIKRHNGIIWAESEIGKGSTFNFKIPLLKA